MLTIVFAVLLLVVLAQFITWAVKISWGIFKIVLGVVFFPLVFIGLCFAGLMYVAIVGLIIVGVLSLIGIIKS